MKRNQMQTTLAILLMATASSCYNLAPENTGMQTSADIYSGVGNVLNIDSFVNQVKSINPDADVSIGYRYEGAHVKHVNILNNLYRDFQPTERTGDAKRDSAIQKMDDYYLDKHRKAQELHDFLVNTCKTLSCMVPAEKSDMLESHRDGIDSMYYTIRLGEYEPEFAQHNPQSEPEVVRFHCQPNPSRNVDAGNWVSKSIEDFDYEFQPDSAPNETHELLDKKAFSRLIKPIFSKKGIERRTIHLSHTGDYPLPDKNASGLHVQIPFWREALLDDPDELLPASGPIWPSQPKSETQGVIYTTHSQEQAEVVLRQLKAVIWEYLDQHPHTYYQFHPEESIKTGGQCKQFFMMRQNTWVYEEYTILIHNHRNDYNFLVLNTVGSLWLPYDWPVLKSWNNGQSIRDKKAKNMTDDEVWNYTVGWSRHNDYYEPWTEFGKKGKKKR
jgi:hypothetical protein